MDRWRSLKEGIAQHFGALRKSQRTTMAALTAGLLRGGRLGLASIARAMEDQTTARHRIKRGGRFVANERVAPEQVTRGLVQWLIQCGMHRPIVALDWTDIGGGQVMLCAAVALAHRAVPIAWIVMGQGQFTRRRKSRNHAEEEIILILREAFGVHPWVLVADRGFARADLFEKLAAWGVCYVIRACGNPWVETSAWSGRLWDIPRRRCEVRLYARVIYHRERRVPVSLVAAHAEPAPEPWYLITNLDRARPVVEAYRRRAWIEEHFRDAKSVMGLDRLRIRRPARIARMVILMAIAILVALLGALASMASPSWKDPQLTSHKRRRSLSLLRLGLELFRSRRLPPTWRRLRLTPALETL